MRPVVLFILLAIPWGAFAQGIGSGLWLDTLDITETKAALFSQAEGIGLPEDVLDELATALGEVPDLVPMPLLGACLGIPFGPVEIEVGGGFLTDGILRGLGLWPRPGLDLTEPPLHLDFRLFAHHLALALSPRLDLGILALSFQAGVTLLGGNLVPELESSDLAVQAVIDGLGLTELAWSAAGGTLGARLELGLPFLRLFASGTAFFPWDQSPDTWGIQAGLWQASLGVVIRF